MRLHFDLDSVRHAGVALAVCFAATPAFAQTKEPIALRDMGSFHVGGRVIEITGQPIKEVVFTPGGVPAKVDPNGKYQVEQMYVQYFLPQNRKGKLPLLLWHGGGLSGVTYETKPDGGDGWMHYFIRKGWDIYISDAMERGRSGWSSTFKGEADVAAVRGSVGALPHRPGRLVERRSGQARLLSRHAVSRRRLSAVHEAGRAALGHHRPARSSRPTSSWSTRSARAWSWCTASPARSATRCWRRGPTRSRRWWRSSRRVGGDIGKIASVKSTPITVIIGDNAKEHPRWTKIRANSVKYGEAFKAAGGSFDLVDLPDAGIKGNSHMVMMDKNSDQVADLIQKWLVSKGLAD